MPGFLSHYIAGRTLLQSLSPQIQEPIRVGERLYNLGANGPDIFFYYFPGVIRKRSRGVGVQMHLNDLGLFLMQMAKLAKEAAPADRDIIFGYTAGFLMHYTLDAHAHPYVYAMTYNPSAPRIKNSADHRKFETAIDVAMLKLVDAQKPSGLKQWELINAEPAQMTVAATALSQAVREIYNRDVPPKIVSRAMRHMIKITRLLESKNGRRKRVVETIENFTIRERLFSSMVHMQELTDEVDYLNVKRTPWTPPWQTSGEYRDSFLDRYTAAVEEGIQLVASLYEYVYNKLPVETLAEKIGNRSLKTGLPCNAVLEKKCEE